MCKLACGDEESGSDSESSTDLDSDTGFQDPENESARTDWSGDALADEAAAKASESLEAPPPAGDSAHDLRSQASPAKSSLALLKELAELEVLLEEQAKLKAAETSRPIVHKNVHPKSPAPCQSLSYRILVFSPDNLETQALDIMEFPAFVEIGPPLADAAPEVLEPLVLSECMVRHEVNTMVDEPETPCLPVSPRCLDAALARSNSPECDSPTPAECDLGTKVVCEMGASHGAEDREDIPVPDLDLDLGSGSPVPVEHTAPMDPHHTVDSPPSDSSEFEARSPTLCFEGAGDSDQDVDMQDADPDGPLPTTAKHQVQEAVSCMHLCIQAFKVL
eukprot:s1784_g8.t1